MNIFWRLSHRLYKRNIFWGARLLEILSFLIGANAISSEADIGEGTYFYHRGLGCVVHKKAIIGKKCILFSNVTLGSKWSNGINEHGAPVLGDNVLVGSGAVILENISIGNNVIVGANAVVTRDVPDDHIVLGNPSIIKPRNADMAKSHY